MSAVDLFALPFVQRGFAAAILLAVTGGLLSFFVVQRKLAFMGHGIAHSMVAGVALGLVLGWSVFWPALVVAVLVAGGIAWIARAKSVSEDSAIGIALSAALALGLVIVSLKRGYMSHLESYLFGSVIAVLPADLAVMAALAAVAIGLAAAFFRLLVFYSFDPEGAAVAGYKVEAIRYALLLMLAVTIAVSMKIVGILLVGAFLVIPAAAAGYWSARASTVILLSASISIIAALTGMTFSVLLNASAGAAIVLTLVLMFAVSRFVGPYRK